jgi:diguanylate cyclase (GGDEF)-like protein
MAASGARAASLYVPPDPDGTAEGILVHEGEGPATPELSGLREAEALCDSAGPGGEPVIATPAGSMREVASEGPDGLLIRLTASTEAPPGPPTSAGRRRADHRAATRAVRTAEAWIGLLGAGDGVGPETEGAGRIPGDLQPLLLMAGVLASHARDLSEILCDRLTGLPGRVEFERLLGHTLDDESRSSMLMLINPDEFGTINERFGPERGDELLRLIGRRFRDTLRASDTVARYGGAIFVALVEDVDQETGAQLCRKVLDTLSETLTLDPSFRLTVSAGAIAVGPGDRPTRPAELIRRAEQALKVAKCAGGGCFRFWEPAHETGDLSEIDELSGVFTGNPSKDYRNMKLLSRTVTAIAGSVDFDELTSVAAKRIHATLRADRVALVDWSEDGSLRVISAVGRSGAEDADFSVSTAEVDPTLVAMLEKVRNEGRTVTSERGAARHRRLAFAVPLLAGDACLGTLYVEGTEGRTALDSSDAEFLQALASQLALALDRARLSQVETAWREAERQTLQAEIDELRQEAHKAELVCESPAMQKLMATTRQVARTDVTILVCGESGTGKELLSRKIHDLGPRRDKPFVVVDCAAIPTTLIESELFGHERGAYTGAQDRKIGRLKEADGGTVVLDEIGELPLEVQSKLLRFVQEKQITPVGGNRVLEVDARVVAATNRDLEDEVRRGRFREDLFHRLNVIRLDLPPLRERPQDTLALTSLFLRQFSAQYQSGKRNRLTPAAEARVLEHAWPGNVRELRNRIMQAVILSGTEEIGPEQLGLSGDPSEPADGRSAVEHPAVATAVPEEIEAPVPASPEELWQAIHTALDAVVREEIESDDAKLPPLYHWLTDDLVLGAHEAAGGVATRAAELLGIPEATFRRKLRKATDRRESGLGQRSGPWNAVSRLLPEVLRAAPSDEEDQLKRARGTLLMNVIRLIPDSRARGAALMGVTEPTFRRWVRDLERSYEPKTAAAGAVG